MGVVDGKLKRLADIINSHRTDPVIKRYAYTIAGMQDFAGPQSDLRQLRALHSWTQSNIRYLRDPPGMDVFDTPLEILATRDDDCDGMTILIAALGRSLGFNVRLRAVGKEPHFFSHVYPLLDVPRGTRHGWIALDALPGRKLGQEPAGWFHVDQEV